ncbi:MAG: DUF6020 family protein [Clostridiales bacterium]|nr:DUF6020 family protein [Clostridiales bacterium]
MKRCLPLRLKTKYIKTGISFLLAVIDIGLAAALEQGSYAGGRGLGLCLCIAGTIVFTLLIKRLLEQRERRLLVHSGLWGLLMAAAYVAGCLLRRDGTVLDGIGKLPGLLAAVLCLTVPAAACISLFLQGFPRLRERLRRERFGRKAYTPFQAGVFCLAVILLCWLPVFLAYYPSVFAYDAEGQLYQVITGDYSTHHPLLHTLFLGAFFRLGGSLFGSYSTGMALHSVVQMLLLAGTFSAALAYLYARRTSVYLRILLLVFFALFPVNSILALSTTKDVLFSALTLLYTLCLYEFLGEKEEKRPQEQDTDGTFPLPRRKRGLTALWLTVTVLLLLMRNNALYALVGSVPLVCMGLRKHKALRKKYLLLSLAGLCLFGVGNAGLKALTHAQDGSPREMLSVPFQQMARTRVEEEETLSSQMRQELDAYLSSEWVFAAYNPHLADPVKQRAVIHDNPAGFLRTWLRLGLEHPGTYVDAFLDNSVGYWFLEDRTHAQIYGIGTESGFGYLSTDNRPMPAGYEIVENSYLPGLRAFMERIVSENEYQKLPVIRILFAPAFYWWLLCLYLAMALYRKRYRLVLPVAFLVVYYLTLLLSPAALIRYMYPFVTTVPVMCCCLSQQSDCQKGENVQ